MLCRGPDQGERSGGISAAGPRQVKRLKQRFDAHNASWVLHGSQSRQPSNRVAEQIRERVVELARGKYAGFDDSHLRDKLAREEQLVVSGREALQKLNRQANESGRSFDTERPN